MKRSLQILNGIRFREYSDRTWDVVIFVDSQTLVSFLLEISLLAESLNDELSCVCEEIKVNLSIARNSKLSKLTNCGSHVEIQLLPRDLDFLQSFLLKYYRDGEAEVDHIDINLYGQSVTSERGRLVVKAADVRLGMTGDEACRILGIT